MYDEKVQDRVKFALDFFNISKLAFRLPAAWDYNFLAHFLMSKNEFVWYPLKADKIQRLFLTLFSYITYILKKKPNQKIF